MIRFWVVAALAACFVQFTTAADKFSCEGRASGYYADIETGCQVYHMCDGLGRQFSYSCPNTTLFQQRMLICDHWYMVNCSKSELDYNANLLIGQRDKPFVEDSSEHPYHRTPRPDLLQQPYAPRYQNDDYRNGRAQSSLAATLNLVGVATDEEDDNGNSRRNRTTDRPQYFLPSHWSTQYGQGLTTPIPPKVIIKTNKQTYNTGGKNSAGDRKIPPANFNYDPKHYKATQNTPPPVQKSFATSPKNIPTSESAPIFPRNPTAPALTKVPISSPFVPKNPIPSLPKSTNVPSFVTNRPAVQPALPNGSIVPPFTPKTSILPPSVSKIPISRQPLPVFSRLPTVKNNQANNFPNINRADNLNIPDAVNQASVSPSSLALPPFLLKIERNDDRSPSNTDSNENIPKPSIFYQPPKFSSSYEVESTTMDPRTFYKLIPSKVLLPPQLRTIENRPSTVKPVTTSPTTTTKIVNKKDTEQSTEVNSEKRWKELRQMFFIPEYDFPLEIVSRPSYEGGLSSFQVKIGPPNPESRKRPDSRSSQESGGPNPDCPKCDPAFLAPGTCKPCVMIRR